MERSLNRSLNFILGRWFCNEQLKSLLMIFDIDITICVYLFSYLIMAMTLAVSSLYLICAYQSCPRNVISDFIFHHLNQ